MVMRRIGLVPIHISGIPRSPTVAPLHNYCLFPPGIASLFIALLLLSPPCPSRAFHSLDIMPRGNAIGWSQSEADNLLPWLSRHRGLSWEARSRAYFRQYRVFRTVESLRGKKYQILRKQLERQRPPVLYGTKRYRRQYRLRREPHELSESPPILRLGDPDPELWRRVQRLRISLGACSVDSSRSTDSHHGKAVEFFPQSPCPELTVSPASPMQALITFYSERAAPVPSIWEYVHRRVSVAGEK